MDVADHIVVLAGGRVEQIGAPHEIYDNPSNPFVMGFLGSVTRLDGVLVRPHDIEIVAGSASRGAGSASGGTAAVGNGQGGVEATVTRVVRLGFEVRVEMTARGEDILAQVTRGEADALQIAVGDMVTVRPRPDARTLAA